MTRRPGQAEHEQNSAVPPKAPSSRKEPCGQTAAPGLGKTPPGPGRAAWGAGPWVLGRPPGDCPRPGARAHARRDQGPSPAPRGTRDPRPAPLHDHSPTQRTSWPPQEPTCPRPHGSSDVPSAQQRPKGQPSHQRCPSPVPTPTLPPLGARPGPILTVAGGGGAPRRGGRGCHRGSRFRHLPQGCEWQQGPVPPVAIPGQPGWSNQNLTQVPVSLIPSGMSQVPAAAPRDLLGRGCPQGPGLPRGFPADPGTAASGTRARGRAQPSPTSPILSSPSVPRGATAPIHGPLGWRTAVPGGEGTGMGWEQRCGAAGHGATQGALLPWVPHTKPSSQRCHA